MVQVLVSAATRRDALVLTLSGELDSATAPACGQELATRIADDGPSSVVVFDMRRVDFCGSAGIRIVLDSASRNAARGARTYLVAGEGSAVRRVLELSGATACVEVFSDLDGALAQ
jgi:anti-anti-sigma factor